MNVSSMKAITLLTVFMLSACSTRYVNIHKPLTIPTQCNFQKFTENEKGSMIEAVGMKIYQNQEVCRIRQTRIETLIKAHNDAHKE